MAFPWLDIHPAILRPPLVERRIAQAMLTAQLGHRHAAFGLAQDREDLFIGTYAVPPEPRCSRHQCICLSSFRISSFILPRKLHLCSPLLSAGNTIVGIIFWLLTRYLATPSPVDHRTSGWSDQARAARISTGWLWRYCGRSSPILSRSDNEPEISRRYQASLLSIVKGRMSTGRAKSRSS